MISHSYTPEVALKEGLVTIDPEAVVADGVRFIAFEDDGASAGPIRIGAGSRVREGAVICSGVQIGRRSIVGHNCVIRRGVILGDDSLLSHMVCVELNTKVGNRCRVSSLTHLTGSCLVEDDVQIGARVVTINDNHLRWRRDPLLRGAIFRRGCRVGSGVTILGGIEIGENALVGAGAVVTRNVPPNVLTFGVPAYAQGESPNAPLTPEVDKG